MFENKKVVLFITKSKITVSSVTIDNNPTEKIIGQFDWTPDTLDNILLRIKKIIRDNIRILLSEDFVYVVSVCLPTSVIVNKDVVRQKAQDLIPESLRETVWDFKEVVNPFPSSSKQPMVAIQVVAVVKTLFETLSKSITKVGFRVEAIEPLSYALARFTQQHDVPFLFAYIDDEILLTLAQKEHVLATERLININQVAINQFISFTKDKFKVEPKNIIFCGNTKDIDLAQYQNPGFKTEIQNLNPRISLAYKQDIKGKNEDVLNLALLKVLSNPYIVSQGNLPRKPQSQKKSFPYIIIVAIGFIITLGSIGGMVLFKNTETVEKETSKQTKPASQTATPTLISSPSPTQFKEVDKSAYTISILNGTGAAGEAIKLEKLLKDNSFNVVKTGNADNFDYEETEVRFKEKVPNELLLPLDKLLKTLYYFSIGTKLEEEFETDILIIVGKSIKE